MLYITFLYIDIIVIQKELQNKSTETGKARKKGNMIYMTMLGRPKKYKNAKAMIVYVDDRDITYLDDHKGSMTRGDYLIESMYSIKGEHSEIMKATVSELQTYKLLNKSLEERVIELEEELKAYENITKGMQTATQQIKNINGNEINNPIDKWWNDKNEAIFEMYRKCQEPNWSKMLIAIQTNYSAIPWTTDKEIKEFVESKIKEQGML